MGRGERASARLMCRWEGDTKDVYGIATAGLSAGAWRISYALDNDVVASSGKPRDFFAGGRFIIKGSEEERQFLTERAVEEEKARAVEAEKVARERAEAEAITQAARDRQAADEAERRATSERVVNLARRYNAQADPGDLDSREYRAGSTLYFVVTGSSSGSVWGTDIYTSDSRLAAAALHAGVLSDGQRGVVKVTVLPGQRSYVGSYRHGVQSGDWDEHPGSYSVGAAEE